MQICIADCDNDNRNVAALAGFFFGAGERAYRVCTTRWAMQAGKDKWHTNKYSNRTYSSGAESFCLSVGPATHETLAAEPARRVFCCKRPGGYFNMRGWSSMWQVQMYLCVWWALGWIAGADPQSQRRCWIRLYLGVDSETHGGHEPFSTGSAPQYNTPASCIAAFLLDAWV